MLTLWRNVCVVVFCMVMSIRPVAAQESVVTLLHFSDYHSHAVPFYAKGQANSAGIARAIAYLKPFATDPYTLIFSGGDTMNVGTPAWSDKYRCAEWSWWNGIVDAMAMGNHDADYGSDVFSQCRTQIQYPILSANTLDANGQPLFSYDGKPYKIFPVGDLKIGVFAVAGPDFDRLVRPALRPAAGVTYADRIPIARQIVAELRDQEHVNAVILIGHSLYEDDVALAQAVPGIDVIFGTHSHREERLTRIPNTSTVIISPFQYLTYISNLQLVFSNGKLVDVRGGLIRMDASLPEDPQVAQMTAQMQAELQADPQYAALFQTIGEATVELSTDGQFVGESVLGNFVMDIFREAGKAHMALSTSSSFREPIPPGTILEEELRTAMPYKNRILVFAMKGAQIQQVLDYSVSRRGSDFFSQVSGVRFAIENGKATHIQLLKDPTNLGAGYAPLDANATYQVATSDFQGLVAGGYKDIFAQATYVDTAIDVRDIVRSAIQSRSPVTAALDGRISQGAPAEAPAAPIQLPNTSKTPAPPFALPVFALFLLGLGLLMIRRAR